MSYLLGIDIGTTSLKTALFKDDGSCVGEVTQEYKLLTPIIGVVELEAEVYWQACKRGIKTLLEKTKVNPKKILSLAICSQGETFICLDKYGKPLRRAIVWLDNRSLEEAKIIKKKFSKWQVFEITGLPQVIPTWPATKILWLKRKEFSVFAKTYKFLLLEDYLIYKFTGKYITDYSIATTTLFFDIRNEKWWTEMLEFLGISVEQLPELKSSGEIIDELSPESARETGLSKGTKVSTGAMDQSAAAIGAGNIKSGIITESTGSSLAMAATIDKPLYDPQRRIPCYHHALKGKYLLLPYGQTAGMVLKWFRDNFCYLENKVAKMVNKDAYDFLTLEAGRVLPGCEGLIMLPYLTGVTTPYFNPTAKGVFFGLTPVHRKAHFIRAIMESVAFLLRDNVKILEEMGVKVEEIRSLGGGARSKLWLQIKADVTRKTLAIMKFQETASLGAAILAGMATGVFKNIEEACAKMVFTKDIIKPNPKNFGVYDKSYELYLKLYDSLKNCFKD